jgi:hypothetical protein
MWIGEDRAEHLNHFISYDIITNNCIIFILNYIVLLCVCVRVGAQFWPWNICIYKHMLTVYLRSAELFGLVLLRSID